MALSKVKRSYFNGKSHFGKTQNCLERVKCRYSFHFISFHSLLGVNSKRSRSLAANLGLHENLVSDELITVKLSLKEFRASFPTNEKPKTIAPCTCDSSRALSELQVIARNSDWFIALFAPVVIGRRNYFGFDGHLKTALCRKRTELAEEARISRCTQQV